MFNTAKTYLLLKTINYKIKRIGIMLDLKINPDTKSIDVSVLLVGEESPLDVSIKSYELLSKDDKDYIKLGDIETSKTWLNIVLDEFVKGDEVELPPKIAKVLKLVL